MGGEERRQRGGADLLLALDEDGDADRRAAAKGPQRRHVREHPRLVVGGPAAVQPTLPLLRLERLTAPVRPVPCRLDVVMGVQQHGGRTGGGGYPADDRGGPTGGGEHLHVRHAGVAEQRGHQLGAAQHLPGTGRVGADRRDAD